MVDVNKPVENPALVAAMDALVAAMDAGSGPPEVYQNFAREIQVAHFLAPIAMELGPGSSVQDGQVDIKKGTTISFTGLHNIAGAESLIVFTDWTELRKWRDVPDEHTLVISYDDVVTLIGRNPGSVAVNPFGHNIVLNAQEIEKIRQATTPTTQHQYTIPEDSKVFIGLPEQDSDTIRLQTGIAAYLPALPNVNRAWLLRMLRDDESSWLLVVDFTGDRRTTFDAINNAVQPLVPPGKYLDMVPYSSGFGENTKLTVPFYSKPSFFHRLFGRKIT